MRTESAPATEGAGQHRADSRLTAGKLSQVCIRAAMVLLSLLLAAVPSSSANAAAVAITGSVEHLLSPLGIATLQPRFSWQLSSGSSRNVSQLGYELSILGSNATSTAICDSGAVASAASNLVVCIPSGGEAVTAAAATLEPGRLYHWRVSVKLSDGSTATLPPQRFSTGLQTRNDWHPSAKFIGLGGLKTQGVLCPWIRSEAFTVSPAALHGVTLLSVASVGWHEVFINGQKLEAASVLIPSVSDMHRRVLSHQYDAAPHLKPGANVIAFWAAPGWSQLSWPDKGGPAGSSAGTNYSISGAPLVMAQLDSCGGDAGACTTLVATTGGGQWKARPSTIEHTGSWQWGNYGGEKVDHTADVASWSTTGGSAADWRSATVTALDRQVTPESLEAMSAVETLPATGIAPCSGTAQDVAAGSCYVVSFPRLINGFFEASSLPGLAAGDEASFIYSANCKAPCPASTPYMPCNPPTSGAGVCTDSGGTVAKPVEWVAIDTLIAGSGSDGSTSFANKFNWRPSCSIISGTFNEKMQNLLLISAFFI